MNRDDILRRFEHWLDDAMAAEDPPDGIDAEMLATMAEANAESNTGPDHPGDSYALWAAMTALTHEVKLEGRAFKELHNTIGTQASRMADEIRAAYRERERDVQRAAERRSRREVLAALIDLRDRLARGLESVRAVESEIARGAGQSWVARVFRNAGKDRDVEKLAALTKGYELGLERLDQTLEEFNAHEIRCEGQPFDPRRMNAVDKEESAAVPEGTVLEVYRTGYEWSGEVFRPAQVKVSCAPAAGNSHD
jgi:molecular chaperone GrpE